MQRYAENRREDFQIQTPPFFEQVKLVQGWPETVLIQGFTDKGTALLPGRSIGGGADVEK
jgi:hypothetical protein